MSVFTFVLDASSGRPVQDMQVRLEAKDGGPWKTVATANTEADGRIRDWRQVCRPGLYRLWFDIAGYFGAQGVTTIFPEIMVAAVINDTQRPTTVVLLVSPYSYSVYREAVTP